MTEYIKRIDQFKQRAAEQRPLLLGVQIGLAREHEHNWQQVTTLKKQLNEAELAAEKHWKMHRGDILVGLAHIYDDD